MRGFLRARTAARRPGDEGLAEADPAAARRRPEPRPIGTVVIGTVKGDLHDIGKNLVSSMLEGAGFRVIDLGADVPADKFVAIIENEKPDIICMSALLTVTMPSMKIHHRSA